MEAESLFKKILQIGLVVRNIDESVKKYYDICGIGPWSFYTMDSTNMHDTKVNGQKAEFSMKVAFADIGGVQLELIEPIDDGNIYVDFLKAHGEGIHHIACHVDDFDDAIARLKEKGIKVMQEGTTSDGLGFAYLDIRNEMACITEIYKIPEGLVMSDPDRTYP